MIGPTEKHLNHRHLVMGDNNSETPPAYQNESDFLGIGRRGAGFPRGRYFFIRESGTDLYLLNDHAAHTEGTLLHLWSLQPVKDVRRRNQVYGRVLYVDVGKLNDAIPAVLYRRDWSPLSRNERTCSRYSWYVFFFFTNDYIS